MTAPLIASLGPLGDVGHWESSSEGSFATDLREAAADADVIVIGAGDGTINLSINALGDRVEDLVFGVVPLGTGNDLARTLGLSKDPQEAAGQIASGRPRSIDLARVEGDGEARLFINACMGGFSVDVDRAISEETKARLGPASFWVGGLKAATDMTRYVVEVDGTRIEDVVAVGVGNGRTVGGGIEMWPEADPSDGELDWCAVSAASVLDGLKIAASIKKGTHEGSDQALTGRASVLRVEAEPAIEFNVDGEVVGLTSPATFGVVGKARFLVPHG